MNYLQKKKQAIIMMLAAQIIKTAQGYPVTVNDCESGTAVDYTVWGNTVTGKNLISYPYISTTKTENGITFTDNDDGTVTANGTATGEAATEYEPYTESYVGDKTLVSDNTYKYKIPIVNSGKNLIPYPYYQTTKTENSITFTDNGDGTITANGTATSNATYLIKFRKNFTVKKRIYTLSGCPTGGNKSSYFLGIDVYNGETWLKSFSDNGEGVFADLTSSVFTGLNMYIYVATGATVENLTFKPQLELGTTATEYEPYRVPVNANIYLDEPLKQGESINFGADNLPELQLFEGSNVITANTVVKPEKIVIDYYEKG